MEQDKILLKIKRAKLRIQKEHPFFSDILFFTRLKEVPEEWDPGLNSPFDPVASKEAKKLGMLVNIINGTKRENLKKLLEGRKFIGSIIE